MPPRSRGLQPARRRTAERARAGFSLLETSIAVAILGIGLIMIAAIFPVALLEHSQSTDKARAIELAAKAEAMLHSRLDPNTLWDSQFLPDDTDSPWYLLPTVNINRGALDWDPMLVTTPWATNLNYANILNGASDVDPGNPLVLFGLDILSDRTAPFLNPNLTPDTFSPFTDGELMEAPNRLVWYGFYRRLANGTVQYATAICKQRRNRLFAEQDLSQADFALNPLAYAANRRLPVPWRVTVAYDPSSPGEIYNTPTVPVTGRLALGRLAPPGSKIMIQGTVNPNLPSTVLPPIPSGRVLTVSEVLYSGSGPTIVRVLEDTSDLPPYDYYDDFAGFPSTVVTFDVWVFPPSVEGGGLATKSPLLEWVLLL